MQVMAIRSLEERTTSDLEVVAVATIDCIWLHLNFITKGWNQIIETTISEELIGDILDLLGKAPEWTVP